MIRKLLLTTALCCASTLALAQNNGTDNANDFQGPHDKSFAQNTPRPELSNDNNMYIVTAAFNTMEYCWDKYALLLSYPLIEICGAWKGRTDYTNEIGKFGLIIGLGEFARLTGNWLLNYDPMMSNMEEHYEELTKTRNQSDLTGLYSTLERSREIVTTNRDAIYGGLEVANYFYPTAPINAAISRIYGYTDFGELAASIISLTTNPPNVTTLQEISRQKSHEMMEVPSHIGELQTAMLAPFGWALKPIRGFTWSLSIWGVSKIHDKTFRMALTVPAAIVTTASALSKLLPHTGLNQNLAMLLAIPSAFSALTKIQEDRFTKPLVGLVCALYGIGWIINWNNEAPHNPPSSADNTPPAGHDDL
jgi:hypothetical protein